MAFDKSALKDYVDVAERIRAWYEAYANGRIETSVLEHSEKRVVLEAKVYRGESADEKPAGIGHSAMQIPGATPYTRGSEIENCETSAVGRALVMAGLPSKRIASDDEIKAKGGSTKPTAKSVAEVFPAEEVVLPEHVQKFMDGLDAAKTLDELTTIGRNINESNLNGQEIDDVHREYLLKKFKARRGDLAS